MKKTIFASLMLASLIYTNSAYSKTICAMTFNSSDEKQVFQKNLTPNGYEVIELVPENKDPAWFSKACKKVKSCDILVVSGHFGGLFFGDKSVTISLDELVEAREKSLCPSILDTPKAVYLMGCNTLSSKSPDHRSVNDYLNVLVGDGFPLNMAEEVAASRYLNFGQSMSEFMNSIFSKSEMVVGFESTGPLGAQAAPRLSLAFKNTSQSEKLETGISKKAILNAFKDTNLRVVKPTPKKEDRLKTDALFGNKQAATIAWKTILTQNNISKYYDFIIKNQLNIELALILENDLSLANNVTAKMIDIYNQANGLIQIQARVIRFLRAHDLINQYEFEDMLRQISTAAIKQKIDYIRADQFCSILKDFKEVNIFSMLGKEEKVAIAKSEYARYLYKCGGIKQAPLQKENKAYKCLKNFENHDWGCLTENADILDLDACELAKNRNEDPENADDMMWFCYSKMLENKTLKRPTCLEMTQDFSILGNKLKMNWNCLNRIP